ncbi:hypothetical protein BPAE_0015g00240 [Botrytis paeoniae]|uniref:Uncharacterized protein n=1 Tax=Botrytis paeoniae TaxID=278948 RepID=A0A4Z1G1H4_9HELO|nr:hypothetical protein BPAE_0015g00240 [Botrytis paeoniae]
MPDPMFYCNFEKLMIQGQSIPTPRAPKAEGQNHKIPLVPPSYVTPQSGISDLSVAVTLFPVHFDGN